VSLTSTFFLAVVVLVTIAAFVLLVLKWPALTGREPKKIAARAGMLLVVNGLVLLTAATQLNARFLFFADWTDLRGALTGSVTQTSLNRGGAAAEAADRSVRGPAATAGHSLPSLPLRKLSAAGVASFQVRGRASGIVGTVVVQLPPGYTDPANASVRYPVLETFSGYPGSPYQWVETMGLGSVMTQEVAAGHMRPALVVSPQLEVPPGVDTECVNGRPGNPQLETWLTRDVPSWVTHTFRVRTDRASWATVGLSAGGWCAAMATMLHPAQYGAAIVMGGYFRPELSPFYQPYPHGSPRATRYDLVALARWSPPPVAIWLETSHADATSYRSSAAFLAAARPPLAVHAVVLQHAGHRTSLWTALLPESLQWLGANLSGFS
jgi:enterochelin esterase-like enzyme